MIAQELVSQLIESLDAFDSLPPTSEPSLIDATYSRLKTLADELDGSAVSGARKMAVDAIREGGNAHLKAALAGNTAALESLKIILTGCARLLKH
ncbi:hypothetical protein [Spirosoma flavum]|uniref:Uncharacterized protein n=1 Tax=Spirosoma flavum TaxID=2048557 RepID=A0ABW6AN83_9BACT